MNLLVVCKHVETNLTCIIHQLSTGTYIVTEKRILHIKSGVTTTLYIKNTIALLILFQEIVKNI